MIIGATSLDGFLADRSGDLTAQHPDLSALGDNGLVEGVDSIDEAGEFTPHTVPRREQ